MPMLLHKESAHAPQKPLFYSQVHQASVLTQWPSLSSPLSISLAHLCFWLAKEPWASVLHLRHPTLLIARFLHTMAKSLFWITNNDIQCSLVLLGWQRALRKTWEWSPSFPLSWTVSYATHHHITVFVRFNEQLIYDSTSIQEAVLALTRLACFFPSICSALLVGWPLSSSMWALSKLTVLVSLLLPTSFTCIIFKAFLA